GGIGDYPISILGMLTEPNKMYSNKTMGFRTANYVQRIIDEKLANDQLKEIIQDAVNNNRPYTAMFSEEDIKADPLVGGFNEKVVALVTANCASACDNMANLLKSSKRAILVGTHSNGTGAGFYLLENNWEDPTNILKAAMPNYIFGIPGSIAEQYVFSKDSAFDLCTENRPHLADIPYNTSIIDIQDNNRGWLQKAAEVLDGIY
ncbi:MAG: S41 family peptidase, partial [Pseudomonadota bacterium]